MSSRQAVPEDLAQIPPGPRLAQVLAELDLSRLSGYDCVQVLKAQYRQVNHERAQLMAAMVEVGLRRPGPDELARWRAPDEFAPDEIRAALVLTRRAADDQFWLAYDLLTRLPAVHAALDAGQLDEPRARVLADWTTALAPEHAQAVCNTLLGRAPQLTTGQLIDQIKKLAIALDPTWARRRYEQAIGERKVIGYRNSDGSANLSGLNLPVDRVAAASGRIDALAKAAKRHGDTRPIDHIRAELFLGMTDGTYTGLDDAAIVDHLRTTIAHDDGPDHGPNDEGSDLVPTDGPANDSAPGAPAPAPAPAPADSTPAPADSPTDDPASRSTGGRAGVGMELRVRCSTLLGYDNYPGELAGWGPIHAELARDLAAALTGGQWRFAITDDDGYLVHAGITRARPAGTAARSPRTRHLVELQIPASTLYTLTTGSEVLGGWEPVLADLARQHFQHTATQQSRADDPTRRFPGAALRRHVQIRDRSCVMLGCRAPAYSTDTDHTRDHAHGGPTRDYNLGSPCRHDHRVKHEGGWQLHQPEPGLFRWISRLGHTYEVRTPPIIEPLPDPLPDHGPPPQAPYVRPDDGWEETSIWQDPAPHASRMPPPRPPPITCPDDDPAPF